MKRFIAEFPGYFTTEDLASMQRELEDGAFEGESMEDQQARAHRIFQAYQFRRLTRGEASEDLGKLPQEPSKGS